MTQALTPQQASDLGVEAARVLENPAFEVAFTRMREQIIEAWAASDVRDQQGAQLLLQQMKLCERVRGSFVAMVSAGHAADAKMRRETEKSVTSNDDLIDENLWQHGARAVRKLRA